LNYSNTQLIASMNQE